LKNLLSILLLSGAACAFADQNPRLQELQAEYNQLHQEQQSMYQQFEMVQELRRNELRERQPPAIQGYSAQGSNPDGEVSIDFNENARRQREKQERLHAYDREISQTHARYMELAAKKKVLLDEINELSKAVPEVAEEPAPAKSPARAKTSRSSREK
jgi:septal ring factor EnvC (AmiA/AmiB activator)